MSKSAQIKACAIRVGWVAEELGDIAMDIYNGNANRVLNVDKFRSLAKTLVDVKKTLKELSEDDS